MADLQENVHIIPLGHEYDRAIAPFRKRTVDRVYILSITQRTGKYEDKMVERQEYFNKRVIEFFEEKKIQWKYVEVELFDLLEVMKQISAIIKAEQTKGNKVQINMSACGRKTSIGVALVGMVHGADVYYVSAEDYSLTEQEFREHGLSICKEGKTFRFENFMLELPNDVSKKILVELYDKNQSDKNQGIEDQGMLSTKIRDHLHKINVEGFEIKLSDVDPRLRTIKNIDGTPLCKFDGTPIRRSDSLVFEVNKRDETIAQNIRLETKYLRGLFDSGYIRREKVGQNKKIYITDSGKYVACMSGFIETVSFK